jgi:hypothetical protein
MSSDNLGSLLALDSLSSEESVRVALYARAKRVADAQMLTHQVESIADAFVKFVGGASWRMDALDVVLATTGRRESVDLILKKTSAVIAWVTGIPESEPEPDPVEEDEEATDLDSLDEDEDEPDPTRMPDPEPVKKKTTGRKTTGRKTGS